MRFTARVVAFLASTCAVALALACSPRAPRANEPAPAAVAPERAPSAPSAVPSASAATSPVLLPGPLKVGILHSLGGTIAPQEKLLHEAAQMAIAELNESGGVLGNRIEPVTADPQSDWLQFSEKARELLEQRVEVVFGCYTSASRKVTVPVFEELSGLLFYPAQYESELPSPRVFYTGALPNQSVVAVADYLLSAAGGRRKRFYLLGTDYLTTRAQNRAIVEFLRLRGVPEADIGERYAPFGHDDFVPLARDILQFVAGHASVVISTLYEDSALAFQRDLAAWKLTKEVLPVVSFGLDERMLHGESGAHAVGQLVARAYFNTLDNPDNAAFKRLWAAHVRARGLPLEQIAWLNDDMEATYLGVRLWKQAVEAARSFDSSAVARALAGQRMRAPSGFTVEIDAQNHHLDKPYFVARVGRGGEPEVIWRTPETMRPRPQSR